MASPSADKTGSTRTSAQLRAYFASVSPDVRRNLKKVRETIRAVAPDAVEHFSYGMPAFRLNGKQLVWYAAWKKHYSTYPFGAVILRAHASQAERYETSKGTIRFPIAEPVPFDLVRRLVKARVAELRQETRTGTNR